ncbi:MAG: PilZ domain-containing protein [Leptospiraceae bacterium]
MFLVANQELSIRNTGSRRCYGNRADSPSKEEVLSQEKRQYPRLPFRRQLTIFAESPQLKKTIEYDATGINISRGGILLESRADFAESTRCSIMFHDLNDANVTRTGLIRRVETPEGMPLPDAVRMYGIEFDELVSQEALATMVGHKE